MPEVEFVAKPSRSSSVLNHSGVSTVVNALTVNFSTVLADGSDLTLEVNVSKVNSMYDAGDLNDPTQDYRITIEKVIPE